MKKLFEFLLQWNWVFSCSLRSIVLLSIKVHQCHYLPVSRGVLYTVQSFWYFHKKPNHLFTLSIDSSEITLVLQRSSTQPLKEVLAEVRAQCVQHTSLMLQDILMEEVDFTGRLGPLSSPLLQPVLQQSLPRGFLLELLARTHSNPDTINKVLRKMFCS